MSATVNIKDQKARLERANKLGHELAASMQNWSKQNLDTTPVINRDRKSWNLRLDVATPPPLDEWGLIFSDAVGQLRNALDNLVYSALTPLPGSSRPKNLKRIKFPIVTAEKDWEAAKSSVEHLPKEYFMRIEEWQPFQRLKKGGNLEEDGLVWLQRLSNTDKHVLQVQPQINPFELSHTFSLEFETIEDANKSLPPKIEVLNSAFQDGAYLMKQNTGGRIRSITGSYHVKARVVILVEKDFYGITEILANVWEYTALTIQHIANIPIAEWSKWLKGVN